MSCLCTEVAAVGVTANKASVKHSRLTGCSGLLDVQYPPAGRVSPQQDRQQESLPCECEAGRKQHCRLQCALQSGAVMGLEALWKFGNTPGHPQRLPGGAAWCRRNPALLLPSRETWWPAAPVPLPLPSSQAQGGHL